MRSFSPLRILLITQACVLVGIILFNLKYSSWTSGSGINFSNKTEISCACAVLEDSQNDAESKAADICTPSVDTSNSIILHWGITNSTICPNNTYIGHRHHGWRTCPPKNSCVVYGFGVGAHAEWDFEMATQYNCEVHAFDPTPTAVNYIQSIEEPLPSNFHFHEYGIGIYDGCLSVHVPLEFSDQYSRNHVATKNSQRTIDIPVYTVASIMNLLNHDHVDIVKIDVEGGEFEIVDQMANSGVLKSIDQLMFEFHDFHIDPETGWSPLLDKMVLQLYGYGFLAINRTNPREYMGSTLIEYTFVKAPGFESKPRVLDTPPEPIECISQLDSSKIVSNILRQHEITCSVDKLMNGIPVGSTTVDIGAFDGQDVVQLAKWGYKVFAFEPNPRKIPNIEKDLAAAGVSELVELRNEAVSDVNGKLKFFTSGEQSDTLVPANTIKGATQIEVNTTRLEDVVKEHVVLLKTDTQGNEYQVLEGSRKLISEYGVDRILVEFWPFGIRNAGKDPVALLDLLDSLGYNCFDCHKATYENRLGFPPVDRPSDFRGFVESFKDKMWVNLLCEHRTPLIPNSNVQ